MNYGRSQTKKCAEPAERRRLQRRVWAAAQAVLYKKWNWWRLRYRLDLKGDDGRVIHARPSMVIGLCVGPSALTKTQAERVAWDKFLSKIDIDALNECAGGTITLANFVEQKFEPEYVTALKHAGKLHYGYCLQNIIGALGTTQLRDLGPGEISKYLKSVIDGGKSVQTATHFRNALSAVFEHAKETGFYAGANPARLVHLPETKSRAIRKKSGALTFDQGAALLEALESPLREMALLAMSSSLNVAELCALRWKRINLTPEFSLESGEPIPPFSVAVRENFYRGQFGTTKTGRRNRIVPLAEHLTEALVILRTNTRFTGPEDLVFRSCNGTPIDPHNVNARQFKEIGKDLGVRLTWHVLLKCCDFVDFVRD